MFFKQLPSFIYCKLNNSWFFVLFEISVSITEFRTNFGIIILLQVFDKPHIMYNFLPNCFNNIFNEYSLAQENSVCPRLWLSLIS